MKFERYKDRIIDVPKSSLMSDNYFVLSFEDFIVILQKNEKWCVKIQRNSNCTPFYFTNEDILMDFLDFISTYSKANYIRQNCTNFDELETILEKEYFNMITLIEYWIKHYVTFEHSKITFSELEKEYLMSD